MFLPLACAASVSTGFGSKGEKRDFWCFACAENGARAKNEIWPPLPFPLLLLAPFFALQFFVPEPHRNA